MSTAVWLLSFFYLAALASWIASDVKREDPGARRRPGEPPVEPTPPGAIARRAASFFGLVLVATVAFCVLILLIQQV